jgi:DNA polymerase-3 subunit delta
MIIHLTGPDTYRSAQRLTELRSAFVTKHDPRNLNTVTLDGATMTPAEVHAAVAATGFFATKRFVAIDDYLADGPVNVEALETILQPIADLKHDVIVVIRDHHGAAPAPSKGKTVRKKKTTTAWSLTGEKREEFPLLSPAEVTAHVQKMVTAHGATISPAVTQQFIAACGTDPWRRATELEKLCLYVGRGEITAAAVTEMVRSEASSDMFAVTDAIGMQQTARALELIHRELQAGVNPFALLASLAAHIRNLYHVVQALNNGRPAASLASELGLHPYVVQKAVAQSRHFTADGLRDLHTRLLNIDQTLKTSPLDAETLVDLVVMKR